MKKIAAIIKTYIPERLNLHQAKDTGMAVVLIGLLIAAYRQDFIFLYGSILCLIVNMVFPQLYLPIAKLWFGCSNILGKITSTLLLSLIFFIIVTPVGIVRRWFGADSLQLNQWKKGKSSVFQTLNHTYQPEDIDKPY